MTPAELDRSVLAVLGGLEGGRGTVDHVQAFHPKLSRVTVWRSLRRLQSAGLARAIKGKRRKGVRGERPMVWRAR